MVSMLERKELSIIRETQKQANWEIKGSTAVSYFNVLCSELELKDTLTRFSFK